ncbi:MAG TPA: Mur ligase family protein [Rickettsiales bacterium]|nr:Mur ligase family protein [Rickettsiales bacterium]
MINKKINVHFIGINGCGISGVACIAKSRGFEVSGCDIGESSNYSAQLTENNIQTFVGHHAEHLKNIDVVVVSPALLYKDKYKEIEETKVAMESRKTIKWQRFLGEYIMNRQNIVAVAATHGKTTITSLVGLMLERGGFDPTVFVGGVVKEWNKTYRVGESNYYVCEGDEYDGNFLNYFPKYVILNNIEMEHPERFANYEEYENNFKNFLETVQENGKIVFYYDDENVYNLITSMLDTFRKKNIKLVGYTFNTRLKKVLSDIKLVKVKKGKNKVVINDETIEYGILGGHNTKNISVASILAMEMGVKIQAIKDIAKSFTGSKRRMDLIFSDNRIKLYDDYAHHHTQIMCTLTALKENLDKKEELIAILEPHLISRIKDNTEEYKKALLLSNYPIVTKVFKSRESFMKDIDIKKLLDDDKIMYIEDFEKVVEKVKEIISKNPEKKFSIIIMGAGNSYKIATSLKELFLNI